MANARATRASSAPDPIASAETAGLRYVTDRDRGIQRLKAPGGFKYIGTDGKIIRTAAVINRIRALAIPPAWTDVWICPDPRGHLQATGHDAKGRKQYRYHHEWRTVRDETKFDRMEAFARALPVIRRRTNADLRRRGLPRAKVLATIVQLLEKSLIRVGNEEYVKQNQSFGLTTLRDKHVHVKGKSLVFEFRGKSGIKHSISVNDPRLARIVKQCRDLPGQELFQYVDDDGVVQGVGSGDINSYLKEITGEELSAKDFRTWWGTVLAVTALRELHKTGTRPPSQKNVVVAIDAVARLLGNTRAVCRKSYVHPGVIDCYIEGAMLKMLRRGAVSTVRSVAGLRPDEVALLVVLKRLPRSSEGKRRAA